MRSGPYSVLVLDPWVRASLAACRALGRSPDFRVGVGGTQSRRWAAGPAANSRYAERYHRLPNPAGRADAFERALRQVITDGGYDVVLATDDSTLARLATVDVAVPIFPTVDAPFIALTDKVGLAAMCLENAVPYPMTRAARTADDARDAVEALGLPVVVKSSRTAEASPELVRSAKGARICHALDDVVDAVSELSGEGLEAVVQSRVRFANKVNAVVIRRSDVSEYTYAHRVLREAPSTGGMGVALETISPTEGDGAEAIEHLERLCKSAAYEGIAQAEFYRSADDGLLYVVDVNPRLWGSTWFAERLGQRVVERGVRAALGLPAIELTPYPLGKRFHTVFGEMRWLRDQASTTSGLMELARTTRPWDVFEYLDIRDPFPVAILGASIFRGHRPQ